MAINMVVGECNCIIEIVYGKRLCLFQGRAEAGILPAHLIIGMSFFGPLEVYVINSFCRSSMPPNDICH